MSGDVLSTNKRARRAPAWWFAFLVLGGVTVAGWHAGTWALLPGAERSGLALRDADPQLGAVYAGTRHEHRIVVRNTTTESQSILGFQYGCPCTSVEISPGKFDLPAGGSREIVLNLDMTTWNFAAAHNAPGPFEIGVRPMLDSETMHGGWRFFGEARPLMECTPAAVDFGDEWIIGSPPPRQRVRVQLFQPVTGLLAESEIPGISVTVEADPEDSQVYWVDVVPNVAPDAPTGRFAAAILLTAKLQDQPYPPFRLPVAGTLHRGARSVPGEIRFGGVSLGETVEETIAITFGAQGEPPRIVRVLCSSEDTTVRERDESAEAIPRLFRVTQRAARLGAQTHLVRFQVEQGSATYEIVLPVSYHGMPAVD